jgi:chromosome segregation ATPase
MNLPKMVKANTKEIDVTFTNALENSRANLKSLEKKIEEDTQGIENRFLKIKTNCRMLYNQLHDSLIELSRNEAAISGIEQSIINFERMFSGFFSLSTSDKLLSTFKLIEIKDNTLNKICTLLLQQVGFNYSADISIPVSPELSDLFRMISTFKSLCKAIKLMEYSQEAQDTSMSLSSLHQLVGQQKSHLKEKESEIHDLQSKLKSFSSESGRQQILFKQQNTIESLESNIKSFTKEVSQLKFENRTLFQSEAEAKDNFERAQCQIKLLKESIDNNINTIRPQLQNQINNIELGRKKLASMNNVVALTTDRAQSLESKIVELKEKLNALTTENRILSQEKSALQIKSNTGNKYFLF